MTAPRLELRVPGAAPRTVELARALTTVGSSPAADVRVAGVAHEWLVVQRDRARVTVAVLATGARLELGDAPVVVDGVTLTRMRVDDPALPIGALALALAQAEDPASALASLVDQAVAATGSDVGAVVLRDGGGHTVAVARDATGAAVADGAAILSDTVLAEVLAGGQAIAVADTDDDPRLANVPSVVNLALRSVIAIPMVLGDRVAGALYLGARRPTRPLGARLAADLAVAATLAVPVIAQLRRSPAAPTTLGASPVITAVAGLIARVGPTPLGVLVTGETGTGKELVARALHAASGRAGRPLVAVNCAAIPANLFESELFGHKRGSFTGAHGDRVGRIEAAAGSTLFLDELGELPPPMQAALLRVLQEREVTRVGDDVARAVDFRLVCATNRDLDAEVAAGRFRADLLYRVREVTIELPPLRARGDDVLLLAERLLAEAEATFATTAPPARRGRPRGARRLRVARQRARAARGHAAGRGDGGGADDRRRRPGPAADRGDRAAAAERPGRGDRRGAGGRRRRAGPARSSAGPGPRRLRRRVLRGGAGPPRRQPRGRGRGARHQHALAVPLPRRRARVDRRAA
ncbi:MAG: sigma-54-dependent Fis family transcriptional regulator, partial [Myxococcales bacterium]|nr:sigma-54-dependent Fis family transcriptional regulator [Myxococcales bacterium]